MKLVEVMACVDRVAKNGTNASQGYKYAQAADVYDAVRGELAKRFVIPIPRLETIEFSDVATKAGGNLKLCSWTGYIDFTDAETGDVISVKTFGQGSDSGDKAGYKAQTGATKACLVQLFLIPTGDDPENEKPERAKPPPPAGLAAVKAKMPQSTSATQSSVRAGHDRSLVYPFGSTKGQPISQVDDKSLVYWMARIEKSLADPGESKWHAKSAQELATLQAEQRYRMASATSAAIVGMAEAAGGPNDEPPPLTDDDAPQH